MAAKKTTKNKKVTRVTEAKTTAPVKAKRSAQVKSTAVARPVVSFFSNINSRVNLSNLKKNKKYWGIAAGVIVLAVIIYFAMTKLVIAWVDNRPVTFFEYYGYLNSHYGSGVQDQLISQQLVINEADKRHVSVSSKEIDDEINTIKAQTASQGDFNQLLAQQGLTMNELRDQVKLQLLIKKMFGQNATVSDQEVDAYMQANNQSAADASPSAKQAIKDQLVQQKIVDDFRTWLAAQQNSSRVRRIQQ